MILNMFDLQRWQVWVVLGSTHGISLMMTSPTLARLQGNDNNDNEDNDDNHDGVGDDNDENYDDSDACCPQEPDQECRFEGRGIGIL